MGIKQGPVTLDFGGLRWTITFIPGSGTGRNPNQIEVKAKHPAMEGDAIKRRYPFEPDPYGRASEEAGPMTDFVRKAAKELGIRGDA